MTEQEVTLFDLKEKVKDFTTRRGWIDAHSPKNLAMSVAIEAAELMEHFQWLTVDKSRVHELSATKIEEIRLEVADILIYLLSFGRALEIDLAEAVLDKLAINETRFPVAQES